MKKGFKMKKIIQYMLAAVAFSMLLNISACGKVSSAVPIEGSGYPHTYPRK